MAGQLEMWVLYSIPCLVLSCGKLLHTDPATREVLDSIWSHGPFGQGIIHLPNAYVEPQLLMCEDESKSAQGPDS